MITQERKEYIDNAIKNCVPVCRQLDNLTDTECRYALSQGAVVDCIYWLNDEEYETLSILIRPSKGREMNKRFGGYPDCPWIAERIAPKLEDYKHWHCESYSDAFDAAMSLLI